MNITPELIYQFVSVAIIPIVVGIARKLNLPSKWAPVMAFGVALVLVSIGKFFGVNLDVNTIGQAILAALATAGVAVLGYDTVKKISETK